MMLNMYEERKLKTTELYDFIVQFMQEHDYAPSYREMTGGTRLASTSVVGYHLAILEREGKLTLGRGGEGTQYGSRAITINDRRVVYFTLEEWHLIHAAWGDDYKEEILKAAEQTRFVVTA